MEGYSNLVKKLTKYYVAPQTFGHDAGRESNSHLQLVLRLIYPVKV